MMPSQRWWWGIPLGVSTTILVITTILAVESPTSSKAIEKSPTPNQSLAKPSTSTFSASNETQISTRSTSKPESLQPTMAGLLESDASDDLVSML